MENMTQKQLEFRIADVIKRMNTLLTKLHDHTDMGLTYDEKWGARSLSLHIRLDEFSSRRLEMIAPEITALMDEYKTLRKAENNILVVNDIDLAITKNLTSLPQK